MTDKKLKSNLKDRTLSFVKKNLKTILIILISLVVFLLIFLFYKNLQEKNNIKIAEKYNYASILIIQKEKEEGKLLLESIINDNHNFYSPLALYLLMEKYPKLDSLKIINFFNKILKNNSISKENLNLIKLKKAIYLINFDREELIIQTLNPIINSDSVWRNLSINIIIEYFLAKDQIVKADEYIKLLSINNNK
jgi:predicted negative regulator of RcsB-dependent stress response|tara:strand:- start:299 stop:880 length:582 start_codon:yes stop_codon:yes gene_type:complete